MSTDPGAVWRGYFREVPAYSDPVFAAFTDSGRLASLETFDEAVIALGKAGKTPWVLITWASVLACTHPADEDVLAPAIGIIGDPQWQEPIHRHGRTLIAAVRDATGAPDSPARLLDAYQPISDELGNSIYWLLAVMAAATAPVQHDLGGIAHLRGISEVVTNVLLDAAAGSASVFALFAPTATSIGAALAAIRTGSHDRAVRCLTMVDLDPLLSVLVLLTRGLRVGAAAIVELVDGVPVSVAGQGPEIAPEALAVTLTRDFLNAAQARDRDELAAVRARIHAATETEQGLVVWYVALTLAEHVPAGPPSA